MKLQTKHVYLLDALLLLVAVAAVYGRLTGYSFITVWDDNASVINNAISHGFSRDHITRAFDVSSYMIIGQYNPLAILTFMLDFTLWRGLNPEGYHVTNIVLHSLNGLLVYRLLLRLHGERLLALVATAVFLLHPVQVESVGWISERKDLLALFFLLLSWEWYCRYRDAESGKGAVAYGISLTAFTLSLLAKTAGVILPVVLLLYDYCFAIGERRWRLRDKIPYLVAAGIFSAIEIYIGQSNIGGATVAYHGGSPLATFYTMLTVFCRYLRLLVWPSGLNVEHLPPIYRTPELPVVGAALLLALFAYGGYRLFRGNRMMGFWFLYFWLGLLPVSQVIPQILLMYEHYLYMPIIGAGALAGFGATCLRSQLGGQRAVVVYAALLACLLALSVTSFQRVPVWKDSLALFTDATAKSPHGSRVWQMLGEAHRSLGNGEAARAALERSLVLRPDNTNVLWTLAQHHAELGELDKGNEYLQRLFKINPDYVMGWATLGNIHLAQKKYGKAREMYTKALALKPDAVEVSSLLGRLAVIEKKYDEARSHFIAVESGSVDVKPAENAYQLVRVEALSGRMDEAMIWLERALQRGYEDFYTLNTNLELNVLWNSPKFGYLMQQYFPEEESRRTLNRGN